MTSLDADLIRRSLGEANCNGLSELEIFPEIDSTNSYLMQQPGPIPGQYRVAATDNQTAGRGRHGKTWQSPPGSGLCLSMSWTFAESPENLSALTLAIGLGAIESLAALGVTDIQLKWPNDLVARNGKLGGILTEAQVRASGVLTVVSGVGLNIDLEEPLDFGIETDWARRVVDLKSHAGELPSREHIAAQLIAGLRQAFVTYERGGFDAFHDGWSKHDWLFGRELTIDTPERQVTGTGAGIAKDGALLVDTPLTGTQRITSGSVIMAETREAAS